MPRRKRIPANDRRRRYSPNAHAVPPRRSPPAREPTPVARHSRPAPSPARSDRHPAAIVERRIAPRRGSTQVQPQGATQRHGRTGTAPSRPARRAATTPCRSWLRGPIAIGVEFLVAGHVRRHVLHRAHLLVPRVARERPLDRARWSGDSKFMLTAPCSDAWPTPTFTALPPPHGPAASKTLTRAARIGRVDAIPPGRNQFDAPSATVTVTASPVLGRCEPDIDDAALEVEHGRVEVELAEPPLLVGAQAHHVGAERPRRGRRSPV